MVRVVYKLPDFQHGFYIKKYREKLICKNIEQTKLLFEFRVLGI